MFRDLCLAFQGVTYIGVTDAGFEGSDAIDAHRKV